MKFLANENMAGDAVVALREKGHDVAWIRTDAPGSKDEDVLALAVTENRILITFDKDFGELAFHAHLPAKCGVILTLWGQVLKYQFLIPFRACTCDIALCADKFDKNVP